MKKRPYLLFLFLFLLTSCGENKTLNLVQDPEGNDITLLRGNFGVSTGEAAQTNDLIDYDDYYVFVVFFETTKPLKYIHVDLELKDDQENVYFSVSGFREANEVISSNGNTGRSNFVDERYQYEYDEIVNRSTVDYVTKFACEIVMAVQVVE